MTNCVDFQPICAYFKLGRLDAVSILKGGRSHHTYLLVTNRGKFVIKQLISCQDKPLACDLFRNTTAIAHLFSQNGIAAVTPLVKNNDVICTYANTHYMVYPHVEAVMLPYSSYTVEHCHHIGKLLAVMHNLNINFPAAAPRWEFCYHAEDWQHAYNYFIERQIGIIATRLKKMESLIKHCFIRYDALLTEMVIDDVVSHRDIDATNLLWYSPINCTLIDWDLAGKVDAAVELMYVALGFSIERKGIFSAERFATMLNAYAAERTLKTKNGEVLLYATLCNWLTWCQKQMRKVVVGQNSLAELNEIIVNVRHSLDTLEYVLSLHDKLIMTFEHVLG